jgi:hypothetical protein
MRDIVSYLRVLKFSEQAAGTVWLRDRGGRQEELRSNTIHVLKAGVFLHLYNLVESTVTACMRRVAEEIKNTTPFHDLEDCWRKAWVTSAGRLDKDLSPDNLLASVLVLCQSIVDGDAIDIRPRISVGNLDDRRIETLADRFGIKLTVRPAVVKAVKHQVFNDLGFLGVVRDRRNSLAHGLGSFAETGRDYSTADLIKWSWGTYGYLREIVASFESYLTKQEFRRGA